jgi:hypothetical protein
MEVGFHHSAWADSYEKQANDQGFTLGDKAKLFEDVGHSWNMLRIHGYLTDSQSDSICKKIQKNLIKSLKRLPEYEDKINEQKEVKND